MNKLNATFKGLITGLLMVAVSVLIYKTQRSFDNNYQYITYALYAGGIIWSLVAFHRDETRKKSFKNYFGEGFKCFIVVTLVMVAFTYVFLQMNPGLKEEMALNYRKGLMEKGNYTPAEVDVMVERAREYFTTMRISMTIFGYLMIGSLITAITSALLVRSKKPAKF